MINPIADDEIGSSVRTKLNEALSRAPSSGVGSPEGVVTAPPGTPYWAESPASGTDAGGWVKNTGVGNTGWIHSTPI